MEAELFQFVMVVPEEVENAVWSRNVFEGIHVLVLRNVVFMEQVLLSFVHIVLNKPRINFGGDDVVLEWDQNET
jgi:hypothetical protein